MKVDVSHVAKLANLPLTDEEKKKFEEQLGSILEYVEQLKKANTENVRETSQVTGLENVEREDHTNPSLSQDEALQNTESKNNGLFKVKAVFDEEV